MSAGEQIDMYRTVSILGYCLLPMVFLSVSSIVLSMYVRTICRLIQPRQISVIIALFCITWCTRSSVMMFTEPNMVSGCRRKYSLFSGESAIFGSVPSSALLHLLRSFDCFLIQILYYYQP